MIKAIYVLKARTGSTSDLIDLLQIVSGRTSYQVGCVSSMVWENKSKSEIMLIEEWTSMEDLIIHISSKLFKRLLAAMEMSNAEPKVSYYKCENIRGIDLIEEILLKGNMVHKSD